MAGAKPIRLSFGDFEPWIDTLKRLSLGVCCLDHQSCNNCCFLSNLVLGRPSVLLWKSSSAKSCTGFVLFTTKESCLLTLSQCFLILCEWFLYLWFTPRNHFIDDCGSKHSSWKSFNSHPSLVYCLILHFDVHVFSPKCFWTNLNPVSSVVAPFITENHESVFCMAWCTSVLPYLFSRPNMPRVFICFHKVSFPNLLLCWLPSSELLPVSWEASTTTNIMLSWRPWRSHAVQEVTM